MDSYKSIKINKTRSFKLIEGVFGPAEAADILFSIVNDKIKFHNIHILSIKERFNGNTEVSERRLKELKISKKNIAKILSEALELGYDVEINSDIEITLRKTENKRIEI